MVRIIYADDWEALYVGGSCVWQGHEIDRIALLRFAEAHNFKANDIVFKDLHPADEEDTYISGRFPDTIAEFKGEY